MYADFNDVQAEIKLGLCVVIKFSCLVVSQ